MGAIVEAIKVACDEVSDEAMHHYESKVDSLFTSERVKQIRNNIIGDWWSEVGGTNPASTKATSVVDPVQKQKSKRQLIEKAKIRSSPVLSYLPGWKIHHTISLIRFSLLDDWAQGHPIDTGITRTGQKAVEPITVVLRWRQF